MSRPLAHRTRANCNVIASVAFTIANSAPTKTAWPAFLPSAVVTASVNGVALERYEFKSRVPSNPNVNAVNSITTPTKAEYITARPIFLALPLTSSEKLIALS